MSSACEVGCWWRVQPRPFWKLAKGWVWGCFILFLSLSSLFGCLFLFENPVKLKKNLSFSDWFWLLGSLTQVAGLFLAQLGGVIQVFSQKVFNSVGLEKPKEFSKILRFLVGFKLGLYFSWFFFEKSSSNLVNQYFSLWEKYWLTKDWSAGFMNPFHSTRKADFCILKTPCVLKIFSKPRRVKNCPATGVIHEEALYVQILIVGLIDSQGSNFAPLWIWTLAGTAR